MDKKIRSVLSALENAGFEAYIIGGYVRDLLCFKNSHDIDITTNATPIKLLNLFPNASSKNLGGIDFKIKTLHFEITTYRKEIKYKNRKPIEFIYINSLIEDLKRRDFTINAICMNKEGQFIDLVGGLKDLQECKIKLIGNFKKKVKEDPLRILRGIRIATNLNFKLDSKTYETFKKQAKEVLKLSNTRIKEEFDKILLSANVKKGLRLLSDLGILKLLRINNNENIIPIKNIEGMYAQLNYEFNFPFTKEERVHIESIKEILKIGNITKQVIYHYGLFLSLIAGTILGIDKQIIYKLDKELPIHEKKDIIVNANDIVSILNISYSSIISTVLNQLEQEILKGNLVNEKDILLKYILDHKSEWI